MIAKFWTVIQQNVVIKDVSIKCCTQVKEEPEFDLLWRNCSSIMSTPWHYQQGSSHQLLSFVCAQHAQLECSSTLLVGLRWHPWGAISVSVAPAGDSPRVHHRCIQVYATSSKYRHEAIPTREGPCQCTESDWNMASHPALLTFKLFQYHNYMPNTKAA